MRLVLARRRLFAHQPLFDYKEEKLRPNPFYTPATFCVIPFWLPCALVNQFFFSLFPFLIILAGFLSMLILACMYQHH
ncbi:hypothetical protein BDV32DRAFT_8522 [Aspergillus pseudonomiae]|uniref:Uncharacterized protein n=1 Tax=Aspergillus pseudonomiae TaxID=1506151 RepID=A0A5N6HKB7_9EURO|nr:uncharacterized protein BDV37DRAFT_116082 [Aspergillus pseudonomiae]KAB8254876.1 hypothetical protein BDV32DRAFT_8522 [Aspergillus pseudonomiae]KAE8404176.1 hypothetical protein BDV37DRAFT_116082 [Aspergillus pseudonomiae]